MNMHDDMDDKHFAFIKHWTQGHTMDVRNKQMMLGLVYMVGKILDPYVAASLRDEYQLSKKK